MKRMSYLTATFGVVLSAFLLTVVGCKKDEPPPPLPSAAPSAEPAPVLAIEPIAEPVVDAAAPAKQGTGTARPAASLSACCAALMQNAASAPEPTATYMKQAAATCSSLAEQGKDKASIIGILQAALRGAGLPAACR